MPLFAALGGSEVQAVDFTAWKTPPNREALLAKSLDRQKNNTTFTTINKRSEILRKRRDDSVIPLSRTAWEARRDKNKKELDAADPKLSEGKERFKIEEVHYAGSKPKPRM